MTNGERINEILDEIIKDTKQEDIKILASRMRNDQHFLFSSLTLFTTLLYKSPDLMERVNELLSILEMKALVNRMLKKD